MSDTASGGESNRPPTVPAQHPPPLGGDPDLSANDRRLVLSDLLNRVLDKGLAITGSVTLAVADIDLVRLDLTLVLSAVETATRSATNWKPPLISKPPLVPKPPLGSNPPLASKPPLAAKPPLGSKPPLGPKPALGSKPTR